MNSRVLHPEQVTGRLKYQEQHRPEVLAKAAKARERLRTLGSAADTNANQKAGESAENGTHNGTQSATPESHPLGRLHKLSFINDLPERAMGLEPTTSSLGSWHSTN